MKIKDFLKKRVKEDVDIMSLEEWEFLHDEYIEKIDLIENYTLLWACKTCNFNSEEFAAFRIWLSAVGEFIRWLKAQKDILKEEDKELEQDEDNY